jgi:phosphatidylglycerophosphate synthase
MTNEYQSFGCVVILADESANWKIAGLRQLERLVLALNEFAETTRRGSKIDIVIFWKPEIPPPGRWLPNHPRITCVRLTESLVSLEPGVRILATRLFVARNALVHFFQTTPTVNFEQPIVDLPAEWWQLFEQFGSACRSASADEEKGWHCLADPSDIAASEQKFLRRTSKSQDGIVSKFLNRPISRSITRLLLKFPIEPSAWTLIILIFPIAGALVLTRGSYWAFVIGTILYQIYSALDGCDGEIARAKYLESERGRQLDNWCDHAGNLLMVICSGIGLSRNHAIPDWWRTFYFVEGIVTAILLGVNEALLVALGSEAATKNPLEAALYPRHREMIRDSGILFLGEKFSWWLVQLTKRDVALFAFVILAIIARPQWILHLLSAFALISLTLAGKALIRRRSERNRFAAPRTR